MEPRDKIKTIIRHIRKVENNMFLLAEEFQDTDLQFALTLIHNARQHDLSKFTGYEFKHLWSDAEPDKFKNALKLHRLLNPHHPECLDYLGDIKNMPREYIAEMVCDCFARAQEFGTSVEDWFREEATKKYKFEWNDVTGLQIQEFLRLLTKTKF